jgi:hypothetical protein
LQASKPLNEQNLPPWGNILVHHVLKGWDLTGLCHLTEYPFVVKLWIPKGQLLASIQRGHC